MTDKLISFLKAGKRKNAPCLTFFITLFLGFFAFGLAGLLPNGTKGIFVCDMYGQYYSFFQALRHMVYSGADFSYSLYAGLGMGISGWLAYYLMSPFNLLIILLPESLLQFGIILMILLKLASAGAAFTWFLKKFLKREGFETVYFGICYAFCGYAVTYYFIPMWLDALILLPIVAYHARRLLLKGKASGFTLSLAVLFVDNYYMAYMLGIFVFAAFLISYLYYKNEQTDSVDGNRYNLKGTVFIKFFVSVFLAAAMSAAIILPTVLQMMSRLGGDTEYWELLKFPMNPINFYNNIFIDSYSTVENGNPLIYCGLLAVILVPLYFCNTRISKREKRCVAFGLILFFSVMFFPLTNVLMHIGSTPTWFAYRYSYLFSFMMLIIACRQLPESINSVKKEEESKEKTAGEERTTGKGKTEKWKIRWICLANIIFLALGTVFIAILKLSGNSKAGDVSTVQYIYDMNLWKLFLNVGMITLIALIICRMKKNTEKKLVLCMLLLLEVCINVFFTSENLSREVGYVVPEDIKAYETTLELQLEEMHRIENSDKLNDGKEDYDAGASDGFYRIMKNYHSTYNDGLQEGYRGIESFNSVYSPKLTHFLSAVGMWANYWEYHDWGSTDFLKAILNVKYTFHDKQEGFYVISDGNTAPFIEENPYYLPVGFMVSDNILDVEFTEGGEHLDAVKNQQSLLNSMLGTTEYEDVFRKTEPVDCMLENVERTEREGEITYKRIDMDKPASIKYKCESTDGQALYYYFTYKRTRWNNQMLQIKTSDGENVYSSSIIPMSTQVPYSVCLKQREGGEAYIIIDFKEAKEFTISKEFFYILDLKRWEKAYDVLKRQPLTVISHTDREITGNVAVGENQVLFTSIPFEKGWSVYVDGKKGELQPLADEAFIGVLLPEGTHEVRFVYNAPGGQAGILISVAAILLFVGRYIVKKTKMNKF